MKEKIYNRLLLIFLLIIALSLSVNAQITTSKDFNIGVAFCKTYKSLSFIYKTDDESFPSSNDFKFSIWKVEGDNINFTIDGLLQLSDPDYEYKAGYYYREFDLDISIPENKTSNILNAKYKIFYTIMRGKQEYANGVLNLNISQYTTTQSRGYIEPEGSIIQSGESLSLEYDVSFPGSIRWQEKEPNGNDWTNVSNGYGYTRTYTNTGTEKIIYFYRVINTIGGKELTSNTVTVTVTPAPNSGTIMPLNQSSDIFSLRPLLHHNAIDVSSLQWQKLVGSNWSDIEGENREYFNHPTGSADGTYQYRVKVTANSGAILYTPVATINYITNGSSVLGLVGGTISPALQNVNTGSAAAGLTVSGITGGGLSSISYQWQKSTDAILYDNINGATSATYLPGILNVNTYFRVAVTCNGETAYSQASLVEVSLNSGISFSLSNNENSIVKRIPRIAESTISDNTDNEIINVTYFDGLGRPVQTIQHGISPSYKDLVILQEYDSFGRESNAWLPAAISGNNGAYVNPTTIKVNATISNSNDRKPYSIPEYEISPLSRIVKRYGPGADWQDNSKAVKTAYSINLTGDATLNCVLYKAGGSNQTPTLTTNSNYATGKLYVTKMADEDGNISYEFKDKLGQVVLTRQMDGTTAHDTYYVYNNFGLQCFVLPPLAADACKTTINTDALEKYGYQYKYDHRNRCIAKKLPECEWIYYIYDDADRLIFTQDGEQRAKGEWTFTIPDIFGRVVLAGMCKNSMDYAANPLGSNVIKTDRTGDTNTYKGYAAPTGVTLTTPIILSVNFYDNYDFRGMAEIPSSGTEYTTESGYGTQYTGGSKGLQTGTLTAQMNSDGTVSSSYLYSVMYYDNRGRLIQIKSNNHLTGGIEKEYIAYNFTGQPTQRKHIHSATGKNTQTEVYAYIYDHAGRLLKTTHQLIDGTTVKDQVTLAENDYDELGRLKTNKKNGQVNLNTTYAYNIRSWTSSITNAHFNEALTYSYNGNISSMQWEQAGETRKYNFTYDNLSRLNGATYTGDGNYNTAYSYDKHGNMMTMQRYGLTIAATYGIIDNLTMSYTGNQMKTVNDAVTDIALNTSMDFKDYSNVATEYTYNKNGAMSQDLNKGISSISYNSLNLPRMVDIKNKTTEGRNEYTYSASGQKLKAVQKWNPNYSTTPVIGSAINTGALTQSQTTDYVGNIIYENNTLKRILVDGGYYESGNYYFYITDHLGNNRIVTNAAASVVQSTQYYPFGTSFADATAANAQPYKYNGKELDQMHGLNLYDYSARYYEPAIGRFTSVDPHAEKYYSISPYVYCYNNPLKYIDPDGKDGIFIAFPDYKISTPVGKVRGLGHAGVLLIDNKTGYTKYYEYGRYDKEEKGLVQTHSVSNVKIGKDGKPTEESLNKVLGQISDKAGQKGKIEGAYVESDKFDEMKDYAESKKAENSNSDRKEYTLTGNNCGTFAADVLKQDPDVKKKAPTTIIARPNSMVKDWQSNFEKITYDPNKDKKK